MGEALIKFSKNQVMEIYVSVSFQSSVSTYGSITFQSSVKLVMEIYGSVSEAGELGLNQRSEINYYSYIYIPTITPTFLPNQNKTNYFVHYG